MPIKKLLLIEDDEDNRALIKFVLERFTDWEVLTAKDGVEGIAKAESERPDVILLDFCLPNIDGLEVCEILKSNLFTCTIPVIFITAMAQQKILAQLSASLAEGVIVKPFEIDRLDSQIARLYQN